MTTPDPKGSYTMKDGVVIPMGPGTKADIPYSSLLYNEYPSECCEYKMCIGCFFFWFFFACSLALFLPLFVCALLSFAISFVFVCFCAFFFFFWGG